MATIDRYTEQMRRVRQTIATGKPDKVAHDRIACLFHNEPLECLPFNSIRGWIEQGLLMERLEHCVTYNHSLLRKLAARLNALVTELEER